jgi:hypothetical protein
LSTQQQQTTSGFYFHFVWGDKCAIFGLLPVCLRITFDLLSPLSYHFYPFLRVLLLCVRIVDYDPKNRTVLLNINLERIVLGSSSTKGWRRRFVNNFKVEGLQWTASSHCPIGETCQSRHSPIEAATVVESKRICWTRDLNYLTGIECDENIPVDLVKKNKQIEL